MNYKKFKLQNGLRVVIIPMPSLESATVTAWVRVGSRYESDRIAGISHFLEHMAFKGGKKYKSAREVSELVDSFGGEFNAGTHKHWTNFYVRARSENMEEAFDVLSDMLLAPLLKPADIERERGVIIEEIGMYEDTPIAKIGEIFEEVIHGKTDLGRDVIGTKETVLKINRQDFVEYRDKHYNSGNMLITISGGITESKAKLLAEKYFGGLKKGNKTSHSKFAATQKKPQALLKFKKTDQAHLILGFGGSGFGHKDRFIEFVLMTILGSGMSCRLFTEVREKRGLAYSIHGDIDKYIDTGYVSAYAGVAPAKVDEAIKVILGEFYKMTGGNHGISEQELNRAKEYIKGRTSLSLENTSSVNGFFGVRELLIEKIETPDQIFSEIDKVTVEDVSRLAKGLFRREKLNLAVIGPYKSQARFEKLLI